MKTVKTVNEKFEQVFYALYLKGNCLTECYRKATKSVRKTDPDAALPSLRQMWYKKPPAAAIRSRWTALKLMD